MNFLFTKKILSIIFLFCTLFVFSSDHIYGYYQLSPDWPSDIKGVIKYSFYTDLHQNSSRYQHTVNKNINFRIKKTDNLYLFKFGKDTLINNINTPNVHNKLHLLADIDKSPDMLISNQGKFLEIKNFKQYQGLLLKRTSLKQQEYHNQIINDIENNINSENFRKIITGKHKKWWHELFEQWVDIKLKQGKPYTFQQKKQISRLSKRKIRVTKKYRIKEIVKSNNNNYIILELKEFIDRNNLLKVLNKEKFSESKYHFVITHLFKTDLKTMLPIEYTKKRNIALSEYKAVDKTTYSFIYE